MIERSLKQISGTSSSEIRTDRPTESLTRWLRKYPGRLHRHRPVSNLQPIYTTYHTLQRRRDDEVRIADEV